MYVLYISDMEVWGPILLISGGLLPKQNQATVVGVIQNRFTNKKQENYLSLAYCIISKLPSSSFIAANGQEGN